MGSKIIFPPSRYIRKEANSSRSSLERTRVKQTRCLSSILTVGFCLYAILVLLERHFTIYGNIPQFHYLSLQIILHITEFFILLLPTHLGSFQNMKDINYAILCWRETGTLFAIHIS